LLTLFYWFSSLFWIGNFLSKNGFGSIVAAAVKKSSLYIYPNEEKDLADA